MVKHDNQRMQRNMLRDPWLLSTSLNMTRRLGKQAVSIYRARMQIEEEFRNMKSRAFGLGYE
jgi:hypothetical protein